MPLEPPSEKPNAVSRRPERGLHYVRHSETRNQDARKPAHGVYLLFDNNVYSALEHFGQMTRYLLSELELTQPKADVYVPGMI